MAQTTGQRAHLGLRAVQLPIRTTQPEVLATFLQSVRLPSDRRSGRVAWFMSHVSGKISRRWLCSAALWPLKHIPLRRLNRRSLRRQAWVANNHLYRALSVQGYSLWSLDSLQILKHEIATTNSLQQLEHMHTLLLSSDEASKVQRKQEGKGLKIH